MRAAPSRIPASLVLAALLGGGSAAQGAAVPREESAVRRLAERCSEVLPWASSWEEATARASKEGRLVLVLIRLYPSLPDPEIPTAGALMDRDVRELVLERFVPFHYRTGMAAPFQDRKVYGLSATAFGNSVLVVDRKGEVLADTFLGDPFALMDFLRAVLAQHPGKPRSLAEKDPREEVQRLLRRGEWEEAEALLEAQPGPGVQALRADLLRRRRDGDAALAELAAARREAAGKDAADLVLQEGIVLLRLRRDAEALERFAEVLALPSAGDAARAEARYWRGSLLLNAGQRDAAQEEWDALLEAFPGEPAAWRCAARQVSWAFTYGVGEAVAWPPAELLDSLRLAPAASVGVEAAVAAEQAAAFLVRTQREDGSWPHPAELSTPRGYANALAEASTALGGLGLLERSDDGEAREAAGRAARFLLGTQDLWPLDAEAQFFMDYSPWRHGYVLRFLLRCVDAAILEQEEVEAELESLVLRLEQQQQEGGGWTYFLTSKLGGGSTAQPSLSFVTGAVLQALLAAEQAGLPVSADVLERGLGCLERLEGTGGTFSYAMLGDVPVPDAGGAQGAAGRGPLCAGLLHQQARRDRDALERAFEVFLEHADALGREHGKSVMHAGEGGQGSHYLMFDYANAALFTRNLPPPQRRRCRARLEELVLQCRRTDGCFLDNPLLGRTAATGLALMALAALED